MDIRLYIRKLRAAADALEEVLGAGRPSAARETPETARLVVRDAKRKRRKPHWTQRPENRAKVLRMVRQNGLKRHHG